MTPGRTLLALAALAVGVAIGVPLLASNLHKLGAQGWFHSGATKGGLIQPATPTPHTTPVTGLLQPPTPTPAPSRKPTSTPGHAHPAAGHGRRPLTGLGSQSRPSGRPAPAPRQPPASARPTVTPSTRNRPGSRSHGPSGGALADTGALLATALEIVAGIALAGMVAVVLLVRRTRARSRRQYALYELHLSMHDEAKPQDLEDMIEQVANIIRAFPADRIRDGQPYVALELICGEEQHGMAWSLNIRCQPDVVSALDAAISATYPDVRLGRHHSEPPRPRAGSLRVPGYVMRFRKQRSFVYPLLATGDDLASPPLEQIARAQIALSEPSIVRFQLTPTASLLEDYARRAFRQHEQRLAHREHPGVPGSGLRSTLDRSEMQNAGRTQNRSLFWLETIVAADSMPACKTIAAAVQSRRGENRLHRRIMIIRQRLYRRRFPKALGPLIPSTRSLVSAAEVAHLLALPTARMKGVPIRRVTLPRIPAPPQAVGGRRPRNPRIPTNPSRRKDGS